MMVRNPRLELGKNPGPGPGASAILPVPYGIRGETRTPTSAFGGQRRFRLATRIRACREIRTRYPPVKSRVLHPHELRMPVGPGAWSRTKPLVRYERSAQPICYTGMVPTQGNDPRSNGYQPFALPLSYVGMEPLARIELAFSALEVRGRFHLGNRGMVGAEGLEPSKRAGFEPGACAVLLTTPDACGPPSGGRTHA